MSSENAFTIPRLISDEMCEFMRIPLNSKRSQTEVNKFVCGYIKVNNCYDPRFKRCIIPDSKLAKLLCVELHDETSYLSLQKYLKRHFINTSVTKELDLGDDNPNDELIEAFGEYDYERLTKMYGGDPDYQDYKKISELTDSELIDIRDKLNKIIGKIYIMNKEDGIACEADLAIGYEGDKILICYR